MLCKFMVALAIVGISLLNISIAIIGGTALLKGVRRFRCKRWQLFCLNLLGQRKNNLRSYNMHYMPLMLTHSQSAATSSVIL